MRKIIILTVILFAVCCQATEGQTEKDFKLEIKELEIIHVLGLSSLISDNYNLIGQLWERFEVRQHEVSNPVDSKIGIGISYGIQSSNSDSQKPDYLYFHLVGIPVSEIGEVPEGMTWKNVPAGLYAKFTHKGSLQNLSETYAFIFNQWLPESGYTYDPSKVDFELYDDRFDMEDAESEFDIYVPIVLLAEEKK